MKLIHLSDLHLGKRVEAFSMIEDQKYILARILEIIDAEAPDAVVIAGDVYDKSVPSAEAVELLDDFLYRLSKRELQTLICSGNHDSPERLAFGGRLMTYAGVHISPVYAGEVTAVTVKGVDLYMLPFVKPAHVRPFFPEETIDSDTDAIRAAVKGMHIDPTRRNVLIAHLFAAGAERCDSEDVSIGGSGPVDVSLFSGFDYVALGHIHGPQDIVPNRIRYCGTPLKYSFSECAQQKSVTVVELEETVRVRTVPLTPLRELRELRGTYESLTARENYLGTAVQDYLHIILTDEENVPEAVGRLRVIYPNLIKLSYDNTRTRRNLEIPSIPEKARQSPLELFREFYALQNNQPMSGVQEDYIRELMRTIWEENQ